MCYLILQVAVYEQEAGGKGMNPRLAVKQYSRSSADQEVPLPHELRPVEVLQMTMSYLMDRIMNLCDTPDVRKQKTILTILTKSISK